MHFSAPIEWNQADSLRHTGFETHRGARGNIESVSMRGRPVKGQRGVGLRQMHMAADLHWPVTGVDDLQLETRGAGIDLDVTVAEEDLTGNHGVT